MNGKRLAPAILGFLMSAIACKAPQAEVSDDAASVARRVAFRRAPAGAATPVVHEALVAAVAGHRKLVVYVGAGWCEPCQRFHHAALEGQLDATFPDVTFLEFDADHDGDRLASAGYRSTYIPLFVLPNSDGTSSGQQIEGGIKGEGAVKQIVPRLQDLLAR